MTTQLNTSASVTLSSVGSGSVTLGPGNAGPPTWVLGSVILTTNRPGKAPVPMASVYLDSVTPSNLQGVTYDGSFSQADAQGLTLVRGQNLLVLWSGGQSGDVASVSITGTQS